jgi:hypothetical protein
VFCCVRYALARLNQPYQPAKLKDILCSWLAVIFRFLCIVDDKAQQWSEALSRDASMEVYAKLCLGVW